MLSQRSENIRRPCTRCPPALQVSARTWTKCSEASRNPEAVHRMSLQADRLSTFRETRVNVTPFQVLATFLRHSSSQLSTPEELDLQAEAHRRTKAQRPFQGENVDVDVNKTLDARQTAETTASQRERRCCCHRNCTADSVQVELVQPGSGTRSRSASSAILTNKSLASAYRGNLQCGKVHHGLFFYACTVAIAGVCCPAEGLSGLSYPHDFMHEVAPVLKVLKRLLHLSCQHAASSALRSCPTLPMRPSVRDSTGGPVMNAATLQSALDAMRYCLVWRGVHKGAVHWECSLRVDTSFLLYHFPGHASCV